MGVAELLALSRAAHERGREITGGGAGKGPRYLVKPANKDEWAEAYRLRKEAIQADPEKTDPAWLDDVAAQFKHEELMRFYEEQLG